MAGCKNNGCNNHILHLMIGGQYPPKRDACFWNRTDYLCFWNAPACFWE